MRLYFSFGYVRSQNRKETLTSRKVFFEMKGGFFIIIDKNEGGTYDSASNQGTVEYIYLGLSCDFCRHHPVHSENFL